MNNVKIRPLAGSKSAELLTNPDRGLRLELYMNVHTGLSLFQYDGQDAYKCLREQAEYYKEDSPVLAQVYFYLTHYWDKPLDEEAFRRMKEYFVILKELKIKAVLRFAYTHAMENYVDGEDITVVKDSSKAAVPAQMVAHIKQLSPFIHEHKDQIHVLQAGLIGTWGEWHADDRDRANHESKKVNGLYGETAVLYALLEHSPSDMFLQVRLRNMKTLNLDPTDTANWNRMGYHDDFLISKPHHWNCGGHMPGSADWRAIGEESLIAPLDGEMIWGASRGMYHGDKGIEAEDIALRMHDHHFTSLSMVHNYKEFGGSYDMVRWKDEMTSPERLSTLGLSFHPAWFQDESGNPLSRSMFEYIRDFLGYYLVIENAQAKIRDGSIEIEITIRNYGAAPPLSIKNIVFANLDMNHQPVATVVSGDPSELLPGTVVKYTAVLPVGNSTVLPAVAMKNSAATPVRFANDMVVTDDGYHILPVEES